MAKFTEEEGGGQGGKEAGNCQSFQSPINVMVKSTYGHFHSLQDVEREKVTTL